MKRIVFFVLEIDKKNPPSATQVKYFCFIFHINLLNIVEMQK